MPKMLDVMTPEEIAKIIGSIKPGDRFKIQFKETEIGDVQYLYGMNASGFLSVSNPGVMRDVMQSGKWDNPANRIFEIQANDAWTANVNWFTGRLRRRIEAIEILNPK